MAIVKIEQHTQFDKDFEVTVGEALSMRVDFDDVHHAQVNKEIKKMKAILDDHWNDAHYNLAKGEGPK
jgi:hypothetical protein